MNITASSRQQQGTSASRRLRREAKVPGILYGNNEPASMIALDHNELYYSLQKEKFHSSILTMSLDGAEQLVVLRAFQMHPYKNQVLHADFQRIDPNSNVTMRVPLHFFGGENSPAVKISKGFISHLVSFVEVTCLPKYLPEHIDVDESGMTALDTLRVADLKLPENVTAVNPELPVATVTVIADEAAAPAAAAEAAAPAAAAAAAPAAAPAESK
ncbi:MAG TPA: 50S ribosomal protein L25 [Sutterella sp.]|jgi:large subunit ribosomal protein L25|nr:50S ribosomal protein L25 [Sutterella sp.]